MRHTVVLVDDLADLRQILRLILEHGGPFHVVGEGASGDEAVALCADLHPDLLLLDVEMPGGPSGWSVLPRIREVAPETTVVILSAQGRDDSGGQAAAVLDKGMPPKELNAALVELLGADPAQPSSRSSSAEPSPAPSPTAGLDAFASVAGHDLAQPLQVAYGYLEMLRADYGAGLDPTAAGWLDAAVASLERMRGLVQDILAFARAGAFALEHQPVDLAVAVDDVAAEYPELVVVAEGLPTVTADAGALHEVLRRLFDNAVAFAPDDAAPRVTVTSEPMESEADGWIVSVADDGPGVPAALRDRVFEPFQRGSSRRGRGAGLGLSVATKLVVAHGGRLWLAPDAPSTFCFSLPGASSQ